MKTIAIVVVALFLFVGIAIAVNEATSRGIYTTPIVPLTNWLNGNDQFYHGHDYKMHEREMQLGLGLDVELYKLSKSTSVGTEYKYDFNNQEHSVYGVVSISLPEMFGY